MRVLIIEDEVRLAQNIAQALEETGGYAVDVCHDGMEGLHQATSSPYDLILLDLSLPRMDGLELLNQLRTQGKRIPVLILTARDSRHDIVHGLNAGSDDYMIKPFDMTELIARCRALIRRAYDRPDPRLTFGELVIDTNAKQVSVHGNPVHLTAMEYRTLEYLAMRSGQIVSKEDLLEHLYDFNWESFSNVLEVFISSLRKKLDPDRKTQWLKTLRGQGYRLEPH